MNRRVTIIVTLIFALTVADLSLAGEESAAKLKDDVAKYSSQKKSVVVVRLRSGDLIKGRVEQAGQDSFTIVNKGMDQSTTVAYTDVAEIKKKGLHPALKVAIVCGVVGGVAAAIVLSRDGSGHC